jgi:SAM-dependent methyltransferase
MGDIFQYEWVKSLAGQLKGPVLEIGSKRYGGPPVFFDYRTLFPSCTPYLGVDMEAGEGVDLVLDMTSRFGAVRDHLQNKSFNTVICMSVLEHVDDVFKFARNITALLNEGGAAVLSVPFSWGVHSYPADYWRFTPNAIRYLFPGFQFDDRLSWLHTTSGRKMRLDTPGDYNRFMSPAGVAEGGSEDFPTVMENTMFDMVGYKKMLGGQERRRRAG